MGLPGLFEERVSGENEDGDDRRRADDIPDIFRDFRLAFHHTECVKQCPATLGHEGKFSAEAAACFATHGENKFSTEAVPGYVRAQKASREAVRGYVRVPGNKATKKMVSISPRFQ
jgi:hypothetical protein